MPEPEEYREVVEDSVRRIVADVSTDLDDEWTLLQMLGVEN
ncbi:hypothetical protein [Streptomyces sp. H27-C3]|nr:hypothetical protein [Streptomyces sp. H27-C3]MDJ0463108.1 hypothetical protein [Streptomyces sp. H27-C3]